MNAQEREAARLQQLAKAQARGNNQHAATNEIDDVVRNGLNKKNVKDITEGIGNVSMMSKLMERRMTDGPSHITRPVTTTSMVNLLHFAIQSLPFFVDHYSNCVSVCGVNNVVGDMSIAEHSHVNDHSCLLSLDEITDGFSHVRWTVTSVASFELNKNCMTEKVTDRHLDDGPSNSPSLVGSNGVIMPPKFQPTIGGARRRVERAHTTHHCRDENTYSEADGSSSSSESPDSVEGSGNEAPSNQAEDTEPIRGDLIKGKC
ncbi:hypothetical protein HAX54_039145 [Datura stramonium]|uniref:Uncharacterized protein n=1 Tax=Datura stramonium TaxID=4076 RepID=A0ABS8RMZ6_DATST|nr:hypothetical protein [Datura stramonium]